jgi:hypothetical protein
VGPGGGRSVHHARRRRLATTVARRAVTLTRGAAILALVAALAASAAAADRDGAGAHAPRFSVSPAGVPFRGTPAAPDFKRNPAADVFAVQLREGTRRGPNFAGYLRVVEWSCGPSCQRWMIVNTKTGRIQDSPEPGAFGLEYRLNSLLLVVNTVGRFTAADPPSGVPIAKYYAWRNSRLELIDTRLITGSRAAPR